MNSKKNQKNMATALSILERFNRDYKPEGDTY